MKRADFGNFRNHLAEEHDSCGIIAIIEKNGKPNRDNISKIIDGLIKMEHRSGFIDGEGDGCGILSDIPRDLWAKKLADAGKPAELAYSPSFAVGHIFIPTKGHNVHSVMENIRSMFTKANLVIELEQINNVNSEVLGKNGRADEPVFWQLACKYTGNYVIEKELFELLIAIEKKHNVHVASLSNHSASYKVMGAANILPQYFQDIQQPEFASSVTVGHNRYSTNTLSNFFRVQPFTIIGHNGEINTIRKLEDEGEMLGVDLVEGGSDSQNMNRAIETLIHRYDLSLFEAMEMVFPPIINEMKSLRPELQDLYVYYRQTWGHYAQGPAGIVSRYANECVFSVDALGLRPLWMVESEASLYFSSEQGVIPVYEMVSEPKALAPGEKVGVQLNPGQPITVVPHHELQNIVLERSSKRMDFTGFRNQLSFSQVKAAKTPYEDIETVTNQQYAAYGWEREHIQLAEQMASSGAEPIRSLGHDAPLAAIAEARQNITDFIKESVAVVTNPAIDREREMEHFSTRIVLGGRPGLFPQEGKATAALELPSPLLFEGKALQELAGKLNTVSLEQLLEHFGTDAHVLPVYFTREESIPQALERIAKSAVDAVKNGARILLFDDSMAHRDGRYWIDPHLVISKADRALKEAGAKGNGNLRRQASIIMRSGALRNLHDLAVAFGLGADAVAPYLLFTTVFLKDREHSVENLYHALNKGLEKVISTIGIHELRGYARLFSSIGLNSEVAEVLGIVNFCGSDKAGTSFAELEADSKARYEDWNNEQAKPAKIFHMWPRIWKSIGEVASGSLPYTEFANKLLEQERENPLSIRHLADFDTSKANKEVSPEQVDISIGDHSLPFLISSMSFGSQNEVAFRAYAEAAEQLNMISLNGEGGEIKDMLGKYRKTRGMQVASGRFGVNVELANSSNLLEIKIGQGAKPGEGGHLPGKKVTAKVAAARNATLGSDLISPSNNHDIYSIEDLAQIITELKTANSEAKVCVKVPVVPNIGTISVGIAKAGADYITLSGFDGGTGAARVHALQHVGLPVEIGVKAAHTALIEAGLRDKVELWADGGIKSGHDVVKMILLGANRIGFGTLAMLAVGCTTCRGCHLDTCHVGIATQIESVEEAKEHGLRRFVPRIFDVAVDNLKRLFTALGEEVKRITAELGFERLQDMVGRADLLVQTRGLNKMDLSALLTSAPFPLLKSERVESKVLVAVGAETYEASDQYASPYAPINETFTNVLSDQRVLGSRYSGARVKPYLDGSYVNLPEVSLTFDRGSVPGNGLAAFNAEGVFIRVHGGAQDGVGKTGFGGRVAIMKSPNANRQFINGSVGKSFCYGAQKGLYIVQGNADARACIRLSGADVVIGGELQEPINDRLGGIGARANIKGFAFEYMTNGRAIVLGDPGPWICSGMTGGVVYLRVQPEMGLDQAALERRIAKAAKVSLKPLDAKGKEDVAYLLGEYITELKASGQQDKAASIQNLIDNAEQHFIMVSPVKEQADPSIATE
ncbi:glutamate synthase-related protein [Aneurinibacillus thermoaerophilus]|uniref:glutamate synthase-related protein n=1 Tax=Aneurinibacillus TaxID=55079 RepID=UPI00070988B8|nr:MULTISPECIES: glutamate synthase-related protein [Aneurinibacillus]AMA74066.1 glutamate synthase [Aneurinibacillus sp. XH2]MED0675438.1 glutamate synthase-related protein [Aneurinibacillus thermoaerophilus]MED0678792.1 glutamate synthase-related protein [Aneurinibacillus thermoaerophilus]MED0765197.1 glutamate synthase-related protein [Aneurinibacillus thermoaerophilus]